MFKYTKFYIIKLATFERSICPATIRFALRIYLLYMYDSAYRFTTMDRFVKKRKRDADEETQDLWQSVEATATASDAASSKLSRNDGINLQLKVRQYCENGIALGFT